MNSPNLKEEASASASSPVDELDKGTLKFVPSPSGRRISAEINKSGARIRLQSAVQDKKAEDEGPDVWIEAQKGKWVVFIHKNAYEEAAVTVEIPDDGPVKTTTDNG
jgi:hypothetical protein